MPATAKTFEKEIRSRDPIRSGVLTGNLFGNRHVNISDKERWFSTIAGGGLAIYGLSRGGWEGLLLGIASGGLIYRGVTGYCSVYEALDFNTAGDRRTRAGVKHGEGIKFERTVTINRPAEELYRFWRNFENLPRFMRHLESVRVIDDRRSHWVARAPAEMMVEWDAEIINEKENELIAWRSLDDAQIPNAGSVRFEKAPNGSGTKVKVALKYDPPGGQVGALIAKLFGEEPEQQVEEDLRRFKQIMEAGEIPTVEGQPSGRRATSAR
jgi:uncharacterized membrane protein